MVVVSQTFDELLAEIEFEAFVRYDILIPAEKPKLWTDEYLESLCSELGAGTLLKLGIIELLYNALRWGNRDDENLPISVKVFKGSRGYLLRIRDSGQGFDFESVLSKKRKGEKYYSWQGGGFSFYEAQYNKVAFEGSGNIVNVQLLNETLGPNFYGV